MGITEVTEEMIDRVMHPEDDCYQSCPLCDYTGHWNCTIGGREDQRMRVRELLEQALGLTPNVKVTGLAPGKDDK